MLELLRTHPREKFSRKLLEQYLLNLYVQKYEASTSINEIELYLSALKMREIQKTVKPFIP